MDISKIKEVLNNNKGKQPIFYYHCFNCKSSQVSYSYTPENFDKNTNLGIYQCTDCGVNENVNLIDVYEIEFK